MKHLKKKERKLWPYIVLIAAVLVIGILILVLAG